MKVLGFTDEVTTCDCCGKRNLRGSFAIETDAGDTLFYGSVCVNRVYGKKRGGAIQFEAKQIATVKSGTWDRVVEMYSRGMISGVIAIKGDGKATHNNSPEQMNAIVAFKNINSGEIIRSKALAA